MRHAPSVGLVLLCLGAAWAHGFHVETSWADGQVLVEAFFSDGDAPGGGEVVVLLGAARVDAGALDEQGCFRWTPPGPGRYRFEVTEPGLHTAFAEWVVPEPSAATDPAAISSTATGAPPPPSPPAPRPLLQQVPPWGRALLGVAVIALLAWGLHTARARLD